VFHDVHRARKAAMVRVRRLGFSEEHLGDDRILAVPRVLVLKVAVI